jgi:hypothetical protein
MLNRGFRILWVKVQLSDTRFFHINLPISLFAFQELLDCIMDILAFLCIFEPSNHKPVNSFLSMHTMRDLTNALIQFFDSLVGTEPYDLVEVEAEKVKISVRIR